MLEQQKKIYYQGQLVNYIYWDEKIHDFEIVNIRIGEKTLTVKLKDLSNKQN